jgi:DNA repair protein NreA
MNASCIKCKGKGYCGRSFCAHIAKAQSMFKVKEAVGKEDFSGSSPAPFVGRFGYPYVSVGILTPPDVREDSWLYDAPKHWSKNNYDIRRIIDLRSSLINSRFKADVKSLQPGFSGANSKGSIADISSSKFLDISREVGMAERPVDVEITLEDKPKFRINPSAETAPMGPNAALKKAEITSNPKVHTKVDRVVSDTDLKASEALTYLYDNSFDENFLTRVFSVGNLGLSDSRKLVPTRWSITAVDDTLGKHLYHEIIDYPIVDEHLAFFGSYLGNHYLILLLPDVWSYELFETYMPNASWNTSGSIDFSTDYEAYSGRKNYAENCAGGYYSVRLSVFEKLRQMRKQASCLVIRVITGEYAVPLGVWVTREAARKALFSEPLRFSSLELMLKYAKALYKKKFGFDSDLITGKSQILKRIRTQKRLGEYI